MQKLLPRLSKLIIVPDRSFVWSPVTISNAVLRTLYTNVLISFEISVIFFQLKLQVVTPLTLLSLPKYFLNHQILLLAHLYWHFQVILFMLILTQTIIHLSPLKYMVLEYLYWRSYKLIKYFFSHLILKIMCGLEFNFVDLIHC